MTGFLSNLSCKLKYWLVAIFCTLLIAGFCFKQKPAQFIGFGRLVAVSQAESACSKIKLPSPDLVSKLSWPTESREPCEFSLIFNKTGIETPPKYFSLSVAGSGRVDIYVDQSVQRVDLNSNQFTDVFFELKNLGSIEQSKIKIKRVSGGLFIRERVEFLSETFSPVRIVAKILDPDAYSQLALILILSAIFLYVLIYREIGGIQYVLSVLLGVLFFLSQDLFYYFDEWHILERFSKMGLPGIIHTHNEHSIIAFFAWYYELVAFFGENYFALLVISIILHVCCAFTLEKFLLTYDLDRRTIRISVVFFMFSSLHVEVLHWAFEQSIILSCISGLWAMIYLRRWKESDKLSYLLSGGLFLLLSPMLFGNGFIFFPLAFFLIFTELGFSSLRRYVYALFVIGVSALIPVSIYYFLKSASAGHGVDDVKGGFEFYKFLGYFLTGSGLGTIGRGLGFYPNLTLSSVQTFCYELLGHYVSWIERRRIFGASVEASLAVYLWLFLVSFNLGIFWINKQARRFLPAIVLGLGLFVLSFLLPAFGRAHLGELQALSLRYQYSAMLGFSMILCPLFYVLVRSNLSKLVFYFLSLLWMCEQAYLCQTFTYFTDHGSLHRVYIQQLLDWEDKAKLSEGTPYEGSGEMQGLFPLARPSITPGSHPTDILKTAKWLRGRGKDI